MIEAFGESKNLAAWAKDQRCPVPKATLRGRLALGWDPEDAITRRTNAEPPLTFNVFDRSLTFRGWSEQSGIPYPTLYTRVFKDWADFRTALLQGPDDPAYAVAISAFDEVKPLHQWALDPRTNCTAATLLQRIRAGWPPETAIIEKAPSPRPTRRDARPNASQRGGSEPLTLRVTAGQLQPGDKVLAIAQDPVGGTPVLTVSRPPSPGPEQQPAISLPRTVTSRPPAGATTPPPGVPHR